MVDLKLLSGSIDGLIASEAYKPFYMHRTGHWLGLDGRDAGEYKSGEQWVALQEGMALTVEPGLYIRRVRTSLPRCTVSASASKTTCS